MRRPPTSEFEKRSPEMLAWVRMLEDEILEYHDDTESLREWAEGHPEDEAREWFLSVADAVESLVAAREAENGQQ